MTHNKPTLDPVQPPRRNWKQAKTTLHQTLLGCVFACLLPILPLQAQPDKIETLPRRGQRLLSALRLLALGGALVVWGADTHASEYKLEINKQKYRWLFFLEERYETIKIFEKINIHISQKNSLKYCNINKCLTEIYFNEIICSRSDLNSNLSISTIFNSGNIYLRVRDQSNNYLSVKITNEENPICYALQARDGPQD